MIKLQNIYKSFSHQLVLNNISLTIPTGEIVAIIGPSGSGKTTLLRCMNLLETAEKGLLIMTSQHDIDITIDFTKPINNHDLLRIRRTTSMVFQQYNLFPHLTVLENLLLGPQKVQKRDILDITTQAQELLELIGLNNKANVYPNKLSGGQQQRVAIVRALMLNPELILLDEPTAALDPELSSEVLQTLKLISNTKMKPTIVIVTHELQFAREISQQTIFMDQGSIIEQNTTKKFFANPKVARTRLFLSKYFKDSYPIDYQI